MTDRTLTFTRQRPAGDLKSIKLSRTDADEPIMVKASFDPSKLQTIRDLMTLRELLDEAILGSEDL